jgi:hypothetical protein
MPEEYKNKKFYSIEEIYNLISLPDYTIFFETLERMSKHYLFLDRFGLKEIAGKPYYISGIVEIITEKKECNTTIKEVKEKHSQGKNLNQQESVVWKSHVHRRIGSSRKPSDELSYTLVTHRLLSTEYTISNDAFINSGIEFLISDNVQQYVFSSNYLIHPFINQTKNKLNEKPKPVGKPKNVLNIKPEHIRFMGDDILSVCEELLNVKNFNEFNKINSEINLSNLVSNLCPATEPLVIQNYLEDNMFDWQKQGIKSIQKLSGIEKKLKSNKFTNPTINRIKKCIAYMNSNDIPFGFKLHDRQLTIDKWLEELQIYDRDFHSNSVDFIKAGKLIKLFITPKQGRRSTKPHD